MGHVVLSTRTALWPESRIVLCSLSGAVFRGVSPPSFIGFYVSPDKDFIVWREVGSYVICYFSSWYIISDCCLSSQRDQVFCHSQLTDVNKYCTCRSNRQQIHPVREDSYHSTDRALFYIIVLPQLTADCCCCWASPPPLCTVLPQGGCRRVIVQV